ncbi:MAG TPA: universal stress protein, partial [Thermoplasmata archaeon]|nr:universal stress protein [Thermoplasmata archaeon]
VFEKVLVAYDGRTQSQHALRAAIEVAVRFGSTLTIATVSPGSEEAVDPRLAGLLPVGDDERPLGTLLEEGRALALEKGIRSADVVFLRGEVPEAILRFLAKHPHDLLVVGTRGLPRAHRLLLGSVSSTLVNTAPCPVLVLRAPRRRA